MPVREIARPRKLNVCKVPFTEKEKSRLLGLIRDEPLTFGDAIAVETTIPLDTREQLADYFKYEVKYSQELYNSLREPRHLQRANAYRTALRFLAVSSD